MSDTQELAKRPEDGWTEYEQEELKKWRRSSKDPAPLALSTSLKMYELFLIGHNCEEIGRANDGKFPLGMILDARLRYQWDRRRDAYVEQLYNEAGNVVKQRQIESALFLGDLLAASHKQHGDQLKKFLQTGDPKDLPDDLKVTSITTYKMAVDALMKVTGQDGKGGKGDSPLVQVIANNVSTGEPQKKGTTGADAFTILKTLEQIDTKK